MTYNYTTKDDAWTVRENAIGKLPRTGIRGLSDQELMCLSMVDTPSLFSNITIDSVLSAFDKSTTNDELLKELSHIDDISRDKIIEILALSEFLRRRQSTLKRPLTHPSDVFQVIRHHFSEEQEKFIAIGVNGAKELLYSKVVTVGLINMSPVHPREVFADTITSRCSGIFIAHNHPSRHITPSADDIGVTLRMKEAGNILGIKLIDHIIFSDDAYYSFNEHGVL